MLPDFKALSQQLKTSDASIKSLNKRLDNFDNTIKHLIMSIDANTEALGGKVPDHDV